MFGICLKKKIYLLISLFLPIVLGCASLKTEKLEMPKDGNRGALTINVKGDEGITKEELSRMKQHLRRSFGSAGYDKVSFSGSRVNRGIILDMVVTKFEHITPSDNSAMAVGVGCSYICFFAAPCLLLPGYNHPQFEVIAEVTEKRNGEEVFSETMTQRAVGSTNAFERGNEEFKEELEGLAVNNLTVAIVKEMRK